MKRSDAYDYICREYLDKCKCCDECIAEYFCIHNQLRTSRYPQEDCVAKLQAYLWAKGRGK